MPLNLGDEFPNFEAETTIGKIKFHEWMDDKWAILFSHPADFTPVCTTELSSVCQLTDEFNKRNVKLIALSCDSVKEHKEWIKDIQDYMKNTNEFPYPIISDETRELANKLGMLDPDEKSSKGIPLTARAVFIISPDKKMRLSILYPATTGRNFEEVLRVVDSLQLTMKKKVTTPANWKVNDDCMILPTVPQEDLEKLFPAGFKLHKMPSGKEYMRFTPQPYY